MSKNNNGARVYTEKTLANDNRPDMEKGLVKLNVGCGSRHWPGFVNIDKYANPGEPAPDILTDLGILPYEDGTVDEIHAIHTLEHVMRCEADAVLEEWHRVLKMGGKLVIEVPDLHKIVNQLVMYSKLPPKDRLVVLPDGRKVDRVESCKDGLYGDRKSRFEGMLHHWCYSETELEGMLKEKGHYFRFVHAEEPLFHRKFRDCRVVGVK